MPGFVDTDTVKSFLKDNLAYADTVTLQPFWTSLVANANSQAWQFILRHWLSNGYTAAQTATWDFGIDFQTRLAAWFAAIRIPALYPDTAGQQAFKAIDPRLELVGDKQLNIPPNTMLISSGEYVSPATTNGLVSTGQFDVSQDEFVPYNPDDPRLGQPTVF